MQRHLAIDDAKTAVELDLRAACATAALPTPVEVVVSAQRARPGIGLEAMVQVRFAVAVAGPLLLGKTKHRGGGVFERVG